MMAMSDRVRCAVCGFMSKGRVPKGGDGSVLVPYQHKSRKTGLWCHGWFLAALDVTEDE